MNPYFANVKNILKIFYYISLYMLMARKKNIIKYCVLQSAKARRCNIYYLFTKACVGW